MKNVITLILLYVSIQIKAQITITKNDMPSPGDTVWMSIPSGFTGIDPTLTGSNYTWDFSFLSELSQRKDSFVSVTSTPVAYQFYFNDVIFYPENKATVAIPSNYPTAPAQSPIQITDVYAFYKATNSLYAQTGFGAKINGVPTSVKYDPAYDMDILYKFPLSYGNSPDSCYSFYEVDVPNMAYYSEGRNRKNEIDGWGSLTLPNGTYSVIRVKSTSLIKDSIYSHQFGFGSSLPARTEIEYKWLATGKNEPVLTLVTNSSGQITRGEYQDNPPVNTSGWADIKNESQLNVYPIPANNILFIKTDYKEPVTETLILNLSGEILKKCSLNKQIDISDLAPGCYFIQVKSKAFCGQTKFIKY